MKGKILVVDDEAIQRDIVRDILEDQGCEVFAAGSGVDALINELNHIINQPDTNHD